MSEPKPPEPVKLIMSLFSVQPALINEAIRALAELYGQTDFISSLLPFDLTCYYEREMGTPLTRRFLSFATLIRPESLPDVKRATNRIEERFAYGQKRGVNIDPGYISQAHLILATGKGYSHRPYLRDGVYADLTLIYGGKTFTPLAWTYPDYAQEGVIGMWNRIRVRYLGQLKANRQVETQENV